MTRPENTSRGQSGRWIVVGLVAADALPDTPFQSNGLTIRRGTEEEIAQLTRSRPGDIGVEKLGVGVSAADPHVRVESPWLFEVPIEAASANDAEAQAQTLVDSALIALSTMGDHPARAEMMRIFDVDAGGSSHASRGGGFVAYQPKVGDGRWNQLLDRRWRHIRTDGVALEAARHLKNGIFLADVSAWRPVLADAALLQYFMVIESVARYVSRQVRSGYREHERQEREDAAEECSRLIVEARSARKKAQLIEEAARRLDRISRKYADLQIRSTGTALLLSNDAIEDATQLAKYRSTALGHAGPPAPENARWLSSTPPRAFVLATTFLREYVEAVADDVDWRSRGTESRGAPSP